MENLLKETINVIKGTKHFPEGIIFIGSANGEYSCSWDEFTHLANRDYDDGYGSAEVAEDLIIVFSDKSFLRRAEYDGAEWWEHIKCFEIPKNTLPIRDLFSGKPGYETLGAIHGREA